MRLINVRDGSFKDFIGTQIPNYAILSHTWEDEEVSYKDVVDNVHKRKEGFAKIEMTCQIAASDGIDWAWVETCCKCTIVLLAFPTHDKVSRRYTTS